MAAAVSRRIASVLAGLLLGLLPWTAMAQQLQLSDSLDQKVLYVAQANLPAASLPGSSAPASVAPVADAPVADAAVPDAAAPAGPEVESTLRLGPGDAVTVQVFGQPDFNTTTYVADDQTILVPLAGPVKVGGLSPAAAAAKVAEALRKGEFLVNPQVSVTFSQFRSQQVSVLGEVRTPGRYSVESKTSVMDMVAQAGGINETGSDVLVMMRPTADGRVERTAVDLRKLISGEAEPVPIRGGDSLYVPKAEHYFVYGEVQTPNMYRLEPNMTVLQAISRSGGLTPRGSDRRIEVKRLLPNGQYKTFDASLGDAVQANDVIRVKERIF